MHSWYQEWQNNSRSAKRSLEKIIRRLKTLPPKKLADIADSAHETVFSEIDCLQCANCCKSIPPIVNDTDSRRIAKYLGMSISEFQGTYLVSDNDGDTVINASPCPFLASDNHCEIYDVRPRACRQYPHTGDHEFARHMELHGQNVKYCPAVYHILKHIEAVAL